MHSENSWIKLNRENLEITVTSKKELSDPQLKVEAAIALISELDVKEFAEAGFEDHSGAFDYYMEKLLAAVHACCENAGWQSCD